MDGIRFYEKSAFCSSHNERAGDFAFSVLETSSEYSSFGRCRNSAFLSVKSKNCSFCGVDRWRPVQGFEGCWSKSSLRHHIRELRSLEGELKALCTSLDTAQRRNHGSRQPCPVWNRWVRRGKETMKVEVLYIEGCPNHRPSAGTSRQRSQRERRRPWHNTEIPVASIEQAKTLGFLGSPPSVSAIRMLNQRRRVNLNPATAAVHILSKAS